MKNREGNRLGDRIIAFLLPTRNHIEALFQLGDEVADFSRIILQIGVHRNYVLALHHAETGIERGRLAVIFAKTHGAHTSGTARQSLDHFEGTVRAAVVDVDGLERKLQLAHFLGDAFVQFGKRFTLVKNRNDNCQVGRFRRGRLLDRSRL